MFIKLKDRVINADIIAEVSKPTQVGVEWWVKTTLDISKSRKDMINTSYPSENAAMEAYNRLVEQLCSNK